MNEMKPYEVVLTFFIHVLATMGSVALGHYFFPESAVAMFFAILGGALLINWHRNPNPQHSVIGLTILAAKRGKKAVGSVRPTQKMIDTLPPESPKKS